MLRKHPHYDIGPLAVKQRQRLVLVLAAVQHSEPRAESHVARTCRRVAPRKLVDARPAAVEEAQLPTTPTCPAQAEVQRGYRRVTVLRKLRVTGGFVAHSEGVVLLRIPSAKQLGEEHRCKRPHIVRYKACHHLLQPHLVQNHAKAVHAVGPALGYARAADVFELVKQVLPELLCEQPVAGKDTRYQLVKQRLGTVLASSTTGCYGSLPQVPVHIAVLKAGPISIQGLVSRSELLPCFRQQLIVLFPEFPTFKLSVLLKAHLWWHQSPRSRQCRATNC
mmetsp:Transcript_2289/g.5235  ORF Transcript_2289/g.5235 Transcript_2289/m.5235 type:complete len:278 (+) Transcript_2289:199-1032(+)